MDLRTLALTLWFSAQESLEYIQRLFHLPLYAIQGWLFNHEGTRRGEEFLTRKVTKALARIVKEIRDGKEVKPLEIGNLDAKRDWSDAEDFVAGIWLMLNQKKPKEYVLASGETHTIREFVESAFGFGTKPSFTVPLRHLQIRLTAFW